MKLMVNLLINELRQVCQTLPDPRTGSNTQFTFDDIAMAAFSVFFIQSPLFSITKESFTKLTTAAPANHCLACIGYPATTTSVNNSTVSRHQACIPLSTSHYNNWLKNKHLKSFNPCLNDA